MDETVFRWTRHSQEWWFNNMANGSQPEYEGDQGPPRTQLHCISQSHHVMII